VHKVAARLPIAPPSLADRMDALLQAPPREAFDVLHALEGEVLALIAAELPEVDLAALYQRRALYAPD
jgi:DNA-binding transcriptional regulator YdaS (Cro superfamily)